MAKDIFGIDLNIDDYVLHHNNYGGQELHFGQIKSIDKNNVLTIKTSYSNYQYAKCAQSTVINANDKMNQIENMNELIGLINENDLKIDAELLEEQQAKDKVKNEKNQLRREMKPGNIFQAGGYRTYFIYLGIDNKQHIFSEFSLEYHYNRGGPNTSNYEFSTSQDKFYQRMKGKKTPVKAFTEELDVADMFARLEQYLESDRWTTVTQDDIDTLKSLYNKIEA